MMKKLTNSFLAQKFCVLFFLMALASCKSLTSAVSSEPYAGDIKPLAKASAQKGDKNLTDNSKIDGLAKPEVKKNAKLSQNSVENNNGQDLRGYSTGQNMGDAISLAEELSGAPHQSDDLAIESKNTENKTQAKEEYQNKIDTASTDQNSSAKATINRDFPNLAGIPEAPIGTYKKKEKEKLHQELVDARQANRAIISEKSSYNNQQQQSSLSNSQKNNQQEEQNRMPVVAAADQLQAGIEDKFKDTSLVKQANNESSSVVGKKINAPANALSNPWGIVQPSHNNNIQDQAKVEQITNEEYKIRQVTKQQKPTNLDIRQKTKAEMPIQNNNSIVEKIESETQDSSRHKTVATAGLGGGKSQQIQSKSRIGVLPLSNIASPNDSNSKEHQQSSQTINQQAIAADNSFATSKPGDLKNSKQLSNNFLDGFERALRRRIAEKEAVINKPGGGVAHMPVNVAAIPSQSLKFPAPNKTTETSASTATAPLPIVKSEVIGSPNDISRKIGIKNNRVATYDSTQRDHTSTQNNISQNHSMEFPIVNSQQMQSVILPAPSISYQDTISGITTNSPAKVFDPLIITFPIGATGLSKNAISDLTRLFEDMPINRKQIRVIGYATRDKSNSIDSKLTNLALASKRAEVVASFLIKQGIERKLIKIEAFDSTSDDLPKVKVIW